MSRLVYPDYNNSILNNELKKNNNPNNPNILIINDTTLNRLQFSLRILPAYRFPRLLPQHAYQAH